MTSHNLVFATVKWFHHTQPFGGAILRTDGSEVGIHLANGRLFYRGTDTVELRAGGSRLESRPKVGDTICINRTTTSRKGQRHAELWAMGDDYDEAGKYIYERFHRLKTVEARWPEMVTEAKRRSETQRLRSNPLFRCVEQDYQLGKPTSKPSRIVYQGTKEDFLRALSPDRITGRPKIITESGRLVGEHRYMRWFERETADGWKKKCGDVRMIDLPPQTIEEAGWSFEEAWMTLRGQEVRRAPSSTVGVGFMWIDKDARVLAKGNCAEVLVCADDHHADTRFTGGEAEFLWEQSNRENSHVEMPRYRRYGGCLY